jgi:molybdenum cofactor cytidylyltransferase
MKGRSSGAVVVLAAGCGSRFGGRKLVASFLGRPLLQHAIDAACGSIALSCVLVVGADSETIVDCVDTRRCSVVQNDAWREGIASSIRSGLACALDAGACCFLLGDQPFVTSRDLDLLFGYEKGVAALDGRPPIVALRAGRIWGAPMLFPRQDFPALANLTGDHGAKRYAQSQSEHVRFVKAHNPRAFYDIDSPSDLFAAAEHEV